MAEPDEEQLAALLKGIETDSEALAAMLEQLAQDAGCEPNGEIIEDEIPEPPDEATTKPGELIMLGDHRLLCGDSSKPEDVDRLLGGAKIHLVNTDPPYNVKVEPRSNNAIAAGLSSFAGTKHHQSLDLARHPEKSKPTRQEDAGQGSAARQRLRDRWRVRQSARTLGSATWLACSQPGRGVLHLGRLRELRATTRRC